MNYLKILTSISVSIISTNLVQAAQTNLVQTLDLHFTAWAQGATVTNAPFISRSVDSSTIETADVIQLLGTATTNSFSTAARLLIVTPLPDGDPAVIVRDGISNVNVAPFFVHERQGEPLQKGRLNTLTGVASGSEYSLHHFGLVDGAGFPPLTSHFDVSGFAAAGFVSLVDLRRKAIGTAYEYVADVSGAGDWNGTPILIHGTVSGKGRKLEVVP